MSDLVEFCRARLDDDERAVRALVNARPSDELLISDRPMHTWVMDRPDVEAMTMACRVLADVEAKRRVLADYEAHVRAVDPGLPVPLGMVAVALGRVVRALAAVYADHSDYREEWKP